MGRYITIALILVIALGVATLTAVFRHGTQVPGSAPGHIYTSQSSTVTVTAQTQNSIQTAYKAQLPVGDPDHTKFYDTSVEGDYAIQVWKGDNFGGEALLKYDHVQSRWAVLSGGGGAWSIEGLTLFGVPTSTAEALLENVPR
jgi:hypothetical protein